METAKLKKFAQAARTDLIRQVGAKLALVLSADSAARRENPGAIAELERQMRGSSREQLVDKVAYTWFNRFVALRFMDVNGYIRIRVVSPTDEGQVQPEILAEAKMGHLDEERIHPRARDQVRALLDGADPSRPAGMSKSRLAVPVLHLRAEGPGHGPQERRAHRGHPRRHPALHPALDRPLPRRKLPRAALAAESPRLPAARAHALLHRGRSGDRLPQNQQARGDPLDRSRRAAAGTCSLTPSTCSTSSTRRKATRPPRSPPSSSGTICYGLEICPRAAQLAELALVFKAREKSRRFFQPEHLVRPHIIELRDVRFADNELRDYIHALGLGDLFKQPMLRLLHQFEEAKNFGSLIQPCLDERAIANARRAIEAKDLGGQLFLRETHLKVLRVLEQAEALTQRYHVVVANPPYMGGGAMNSALKTFVSESFPAGKADLYGAFILRNLRLVTANGFVGMITIPNWLFLDGFTTFRSVVLDTSYLSSLVHNGRGVWGGDFGSCAFTIVKAAHKARHGVYKRLFKTPGEIQANEEIEGNFHNTVNFPNYLACSSDFEVVPGRIIAYWAAPQLLRAFQNNPPLGGRLDTAQGMKTLDIAI
jgi:hypothetical protein